MCLALLQIIVHEKSSLDDDSDSYDDIESDQWNLYFAISMSFNCNKHLNTFTMVVGLDFKLLRQKHEIVLFFYCILFQLRVPGSMITLKTMTEIITFVF